MQAILRTTVVLAIGLLAAGCASTTMKPAESANVAPPPTNYRAAAVESVKQTFFDPYSIRDASISEPLYASAVFDGITPIPRKGWIVCLRANAKNRMGGYIGQQLTVMLFNGEAVDIALSGREYEGQLQDHCKTARFSDFDEIEAIG